MLVDRLHLVGQEIYLCHAHGVVGVEGIGQGKSDRFEIKHERIPRFQRPFGEVLERFGEDLQAVGELLV